MKSQGVLFSDLFDPDVIGDGPKAGFDVSGVPQHFAALKYGLKRANIGYAINGSDLSNLWAAKGTASYPLSINGSTFFAAGSSGTTTSTASVRFIITTSAGAWEVISQHTGGSSGTIVQASGVSPPGAVSVQYSAVENAGSDPGGSITNTATSPTAFASLPVIQLGAGGGPSTSKSISFSITIVYFNASSQAISTTNVTFDVSIN